MAAEETVRYRLRQDILLLRARVRIHRHKAALNRPNALLSFV